MKIAFVGKGGSGKTTLSSLFIRRLAAQGVPTLAIDADINQHLGDALGVDESATLPTLADHMSLIKEYLRGTNPRIATTASMIKTTPPGAGSRLLQLQESNPIHEACIHPVKLDDNVVQLMVTGPFSDADLGVACYHSKVGAVELYLNHLIDGSNEYVVIDMTAGADSFASGIFTRFDITFLVAEPTRKGVSVYHQYKGHAQGFDVAIKVIGNKIKSQEDIDFLQDEVGDDLLLTDTGTPITISDSAWVRSLEKGRAPAFSLLEESNRVALAALETAANATYAQRDWQRYTQQMHDFHRKNAESWGNERTGVDLVNQIDPTFVLSEDLLSTEAVA